MPLAQQTAIHWKVFDLEMLIIVLLTESGGSKSKLQASRPDWPLGLVQPLPLPKAAAGLLWAQFLQGPALH